MTRNEQRPLYRIIADDIKEKILQGEMRADDPIPTQIELAKIYQASEITTRRALAELVDEGLIYRIRGKGTFVKNRSLAPNHKSSVPKVKQIYFLYQELPLRIFHHPFYSELLQGLSDLCRENGIPLHLWDIGADHVLPDEEDAGYVVLPIKLQPEQIHADRLAQWKREGKRIVTVQFHYPQLKIPYVISDNLTGGFVATQHLLSLEHRRVGIILTGKSLMDVNQEFSLRLQGYRLALSQHQVEFDPDLVCIIEGAEETEMMGYRGFKQLMSLKEPPTAIFATSDYKAAGVMQAARDLRLEVPGDISVIGYDDVLTSELLYPGLTTVNQHTYQVGRRAGELLIFEWNDGDQAELLKDEIVPTLIVRGSTAKAKQYQNS